jgi:HlyD family secretion protein
MSRLSNLAGKRAGAIAIVVLALFAAGFWISRRADAKEESAYRFAAVERGDVQSSVSATGSLSAVTTVQVGTQVSGQVAGIYADFNSQVKKGQLLARIDPTLAEQSVREAQAGLERAVAERDQAQRTYDRNKQLFDRKVLTESEMNDAQYSLAVARASVKSAQVSLERARRNLAYTEIYAPIDGVVVERNVDVGQTVAASLSAPQLFLIANDLSQMQILAAVDESDIGSIHEGMAVRFTVQSYPDEEFTGTVKQVRLQSTTTENVVNYTAVVTVENTGGRLRPGMTATAQFVTGEARAVLHVPNSALRFRPTDQMLKEAGITAPQGARGDSAKASGGASAGGAAGQRGQAGGARSGGQRSGGASGQRSRGGLLWYVNDTGTLSTVRVRTGITDGKNTQVEGTGLREGMQVIVGVTQGDAAAQQAPNPFGGNQQRQGGGPPRGPGF